jgi:threonine/homoserine/homoserine lactone efflux protein
MQIFVITFIISFLGSIHPGPLNVSVVEITLKNSLKAGLFMCIGGVIPEFFYSYLAAEGVMFFQRNRAIFIILQWLMVCILLLMGIYTIYAKEKSIKNKELSTNSFLKGFLLSLFNPQLLVFWLLIVVYYQGIHWLKLTTSFDKIVFIFGATLGAFTLNYIYASWAFSKREFIFSNINRKKFNILIGGSFITMAIIQMVKMIWN